MLAVGVGCFRSACFGHMSPYVVRVLLHWSVQNVLLVGNPSANAERLYDAVAHIESKGFVVDGLVGVAINVVVQSHFQVILHVGICEVNRVRCVYSDVNIGTRILSQIQEGRV